MPPFLPSCLRNGVTLPLLGLLAMGGCGEEGPKFPVPPVASKSFGPPAAVEHFVFRPTFETSEGTFTAGTAFAVTIPGEERPILLTAVHVLGDLASREPGKPPRDLRKEIKKVTLVDCFDEGYIVDAGNDVLPIDAAPDWESSKVGDGARAGDILAIRLPAGAKLATARLAASTPPIDASAWLAAQVLEGAPPTERLHDLRIDDLPRTPTSDLYYEFRNMEIDHRATSGAPILNGDGDVVAINLGLGFANPVVRFRDYLEKAAEASPAR